MVAARRVWAIDRTNSDPSQRSDRQERAKYVSLSETRYQVNFERVGRIASFSLSRTTQEFALAHAWSLVSPVCADAPRYETETLAAALPDGS
jgi:hypothetical protein